MDRLNGTTIERLLAANMDPGVLRPYVAEDGKAYVTINGVARPVGNATLRKDEWKQYDEAVVRAARTRLVGVNFLIGKGLVFTVNGMSKTVLEHETLNDMTDAVLSMDGITEADRDRANYELAGLPLPIISKDFRLSTRVLNMSRTTGQSLDTTQAEQASRKVAEKSESMLFTGTSNYKFGSYIVYGLTDHPNRNTGSLTANWDDSAASGATILADVLEMKQVALDDGFYGPYVLFVPGNFETALDDDFKANSDRTVRERLLAISGISDIIVSDSLTDDNVVLVQLTTDVVRIVNGMAVSTLQWESHGGMQTMFKVMSIQVPQIRADQNGKSGVVHYS